MKKTLLELQRELDDTENIIRACDTAQVYGLTLDSASFDKYNEATEKQKELLSGYPLDYMIQGQHFLGPDKEQVYVGHPFKEEAYLAEYARLSIEGIESGDYLYLAHPDLPHFLGDDKTYRKYMLPVCEALKKENKPAEINILGLADQRHYPVDRFWKLAKEVGVKAILGVDAHSPAQLLNREGIKQGEQWAEKYGIKLLEKMQELA